MDQISEAQPPEDIAQGMADAAAEDKALMLREMTYRELLITNKPSLAFQNGVFMFFSYILGGLLPLLSYFILPIKSALIVSVIVTLIGLFGVGAYTTKYSRESWLKAGGRVLVLGMVAMGVGFIIGWSSHPNWPTKYDSLAGFVLGVKYRSTSDAMSSCGRREGVARPEAAA